MQMEKKDFSSQSNLHNVKNVYIISSNYTLSFANKLKDYISRYRLNIEIIIINNDVIKENIIRSVIKNDISLIVIGFANIKNYDIFSHIKDKIVVIQTEQIHNLENQFNGNKNNYIEFISKFKYLYDYNIQNHDLYYNKFKIINIPINYYLFHSDIKDIDVLFIGTLNLRRKKILDQLKNKNINVRIVSNVFHNDLTEYIKKSKIVINLHINKKAIFEYFRINEIISYNTHIISETVSNENIVNDYKNFVNFVPIIKDDLSNIDILIKKINNLSKIKYTKHPELEAFILKNNIGFNKEVEYFSRKLFNIKTDIILNPSLANESLEYKNKLLLKEEIDTQHKLLNHINLQINESRDTLDFENSMNSKLYEEQKNIKLIINKSSLTQDTLKTNIKDKTIQLNQIKYKLDNIIDKLNSSDVSLEKLEKEYNNLLKEETPADILYSNALDKKNKIENIIELNKININTLINTNNQTIQEAIDMQTTTSEFIREAEDKAQSLLVQTYKRRIDMQNMINKCKNDNIDCQYLQNELAEILLEELENSESIIYSKINAEKNLAIRIKECKNKIKYITDEKNNIEDIINTNIDLLKNTIEINIEKYEKEKNTIKLLKSSAKAKLDVEIKNNTELFNNKNKFQELFNNINEEIIKDNKNLEYEYSQYNIFKDQLDSFESQQIGMGNKINKSSSKYEINKNEKKIIENKLVELISKRKELDLQLENKFEDIKEEEFINTINKIAEKNALTDKTNNISWGIKQNNLENNIEKHKLEIINARKAQAVKNIPEIDKYLKFPNLFNKYILNIAKETKPEYSVIQKSRNNIKKLIAHLHCYNITIFYDMYGDYLENIQKYFTIIITYSIGKLTERIDYILLKIPNKGLDIGGKICAISYLNNNKIDFTHMLFLHSKTNEKDREKYFSFINKNNFDTTITKINNDYDGIFPNIQKNGDWNTKKFSINKTYVDEILNYLKLMQVDTEFIEGNCMVLGKRIVDKIFSNNINIFYNILNSGNSFDINWIKWYYKFNKDDDYIKIFDVYQNKKLIGNNINNPSKINIPKEYDINLPLQGYQLRDGMIEHAFERIYLNVIKNFKGSYYISN